MLGVHVMGDVVSVREKSALVLYDGMYTLTSTSLLSFEFLSVCYVSG